MEKLVHVLFDPGSEVKTMEQFVTFTIHHTEGEISVLQ